MARPRKLLSEQTGHLTVYIKERRKIEEESVRQSVKLPAKPPAYLDKLAKKEWKAKVSLMNENDTIGELDRANFEGYCINYSGLVQTTRRLETLRKETPDDLETEAELLKMQKTYASEMRAFESKCGLDLSSRLKAASNNFDKETADIESKFGVI